MASVPFEISDDLLAKLRNGPREAGNELQLAASFSLCRMGELSTSQAARLAGLAYADFLDAAAQAKIELFPVNFDDLIEEMRDGYTLGRQCVAGDSAGASGAT